MEVRLVVSVLVSRGEKKTLNISILAGSQMPKSLANFKSNPLFVDYFSTDFRVE